MKEKAQLLYNKFQNYLLENIHERRFENLTRDQRLNIVNPEFQAQKTNLNQLIRSCREALNDYQPNREIPTSQIALYTCATILSVLYGFNSVFELDYALIIGGSQLVKQERDVIDELFKLEAKSSLSQSEQPKIERPNIMASKCIREIGERDIDLLVLFQAEIDKSEPEPMVMRGLVEDWPAVSKWKDINYLMKSTSGGERLVPCEIGKNYLSEDWKQEIIPFKQFVDRFIVTRKEHGYVAQHDLLNQISSLKEDVLVPDIAYVDTENHKYPRPQAVALYYNVWIGYDTVSPLHYDNFFNLFCQVVGYKYVRLYPPNTAGIEAIQKYVDDHGKTIDMANTSSVNVRFSSPEEVDSGRKISPEFPWDSNYIDVVLGPGDCLFIPRGWWHFIESSSFSISVSLWF